MPSELIHPNWHVVLIHYPIAFLTFGLAVELFSFLYRHGTLRSAGRWMLLIGALSCLPAATSGVHAYYDTIRFAGQHDAMGGDAWYQLARDAQSHLTIQQWDDLNHHIWRAGSETIIVIFGVLLYLGASDRWRRHLYFPCLLLILFAAVVLMSGAWYAGESVHVRGTAMKPGAGGVVLDREHVEVAVRGIVPPLQVHALLAGLTMAMAVVAVGLSIRAMVVGGPVKVRRAEVETHDTVYSDSPVVQQEMIVVGPAVVKPARFWLLAVLLSLGTGAAGAWVAGWSLEQIKPLVGQPRDLAHMILGSGIVLLTVVLAGVTRWGGKRKWLIGGLAALLFLVIGAQVWMGILLMYDGSDGGASLFQFRRPVVQLPSSSEIRTGN